MSNPPSVPAPNPYFSGIIYNPSDFLSISGDSALTYSQAIALFIQKTISDSVTGITNFVSGLTTSSILAKTITDTCNLWTNANGRINIGTLGGRTHGIHIGDGDNNVGGSAVHINNGINTASNVQILHGTGSTGTINLGSATSTTNVNSILTLAKPIRLGTSATVNTQLGFRTVILNNSTFSTVVGVVVTISSFTVPSDGAWLAQAYMANGTQPITYNLSDASVFTGQFALSVPAFANGQMTYVLKGTGTIYFLAQLASTVSTANSVNFIVTRIG
jgi:hypothetical protein